MSKIRIKFGLTHFLYKERKNMNLKQKIKNLVKSNKPDENLFLELSNFKKKLINSSKINYKLYNKLTDVECSVYRYNNFLKNNMPDYAEKESKFLMDLSNNDSEVLEGGINNIKYIWRTEPNACKKCQELDGTVYILEEDIPEKPHPNCKCYIEEVTDEECEYCVSLLDNFEQVLTDATTVLYESYTILNEFIIFATSEISLIAQQKINVIIDELQQIIGAFSDFLSSYIELKNLNRQKYHEGSPEYFHQKANCQAAQRGEIGEATAIVLGRMREFTDFYKDIYIKGKTIEEAEYNNQYDFEQNAQGREIGRNNPDGNCDEILKGRIKVDWSIEF